MKIKIKKRYGDFPFAHRQPSHDGHCALIHGHGWYFEFTFVCNEVEKGTGFVVDFGKLKGLRKWLEDRFDHTLVLNDDDPELEYLLRFLGGKPQGDIDLRRATPDGPTLAKIVPVPNCSCEGLAVWLLEQVNKEFFWEGAPQGTPELFNRHVRVVEVTVFEDNKNSATSYVTDI